jgi:hypothetical protein
VAFVELTAWKLFSGDMYCVANRHWFRIDFLVEGYYLANPTSIRYLFTRYASPSVPSFAGLVAL